MRPHFKRGYTMQINTDFGTVNITGDTQDDSFCFNGWHYNNDYTAVYVSYWYEGEEHEQRSSGDDIVIGY